ncbi:RNA methyltransferase [Alloacidobacterium dinghuense]|uniref:RNA methyltransferase n=1 Tax=Alloacidobacterium dinghuense TaxID=2763107 RepID=A0A7G8BFS5_9BACT|nr:TrmH family RNA methyltransferase [Alloacidobacterium dinghuense]QNI31395.1 RNA methyltransferase [Alloacidobacterium dinghuense]
MLTGEQLERVCVVLVRARNPNNIGAVARAMYGFGFEELRVVSEYPVALSEARSAVDAAEVLAGAREFSRLADAIADCTLVIGTTAGGKRVQEHPLYPLAEGGGIVRAHLSSDDRSRVALIFGSEKTGLSRDELSYCNWTMTIPMFEREGVRHPSMNLGQAAAVCLYELIRGGDLPASVAVADAMAGDLDRLTILLAELLDKSEYTRRHPASGDAAALRRLVRRMQFDSADAAMWMGILRQALWKIRDKRP